MQNNPLISIITPSFNQSKYLELSILSVVNQDYPNLEYIIVDGGSTDGSQEIIRKYANKLAWWVSEKDGGQADAFNKGLHQSNGKYIGWLNSDDLYMQGTVSHAINVLELNPEIAFVFGDVQSIDENGDVTNVMRYGNWELIDLMKFRIIGQPAVFMRKDLLMESGGLDLSYHFLLDHHLWLKLASKSPIKYINKIWAAARFHAEAKNIASAEKFGEEAYRLVEWMERNPDLNQIFMANHKKILAGAHRMDARYLLDGGNYKQSRKNYWRGIMLDFPTILPELHRLIFAYLAPFGLQKLKGIYLKLRHLITRPDLTKTR